MSNFQENGFKIQVIAKGSFIDEERFLIETTVIRLNHVALNAWILSERMNCRECYETAEEWEEHKAIYAARRKAWNARIINELGVDAALGSISIDQSQAEVFTVVHIYEIAKKEDSNE